MYQFHLPSLLVANTSVITLCGLLLLFTWLRGREQRLLLWAGIMLLLASVGLVLNALRGQGMDWLPIIVGNMLLLLCAATNWTAMRLFCGRSPRYAWVLAGSLVWLAVCFWPAFYDSLQARVQFNAVLIGLYMLAALFELWRARSQLDVSPLPAMILIAFHFAFISLRALLSPEKSVGALQNSPLFGYLLIESLLYAVGIAFVILSMVKERAEHGLRLAAYRDVLTGVANRRGFLESGERLLSLCRRQQQPLALLLFDLDHFKRINDGFGHAAGDQVLVDFATLVQNQMRKEDIFARIGGEEFACLIVANRWQAMAVAERIRCLFFATGSDGLLRSVSAGIAFSGSKDHDLARLLALADQALYRAKHQGRNRVECQGGDDSPGVAQAGVGISR